MRVLVAGAYGFIGARVAARLVRAGMQVRAAGRDAARGRRLYPDWEWVEADFGRAVDWAALLAGVDAVVNCVGVLQDGGRDSTRAAHVEGAAALYDACERAQVRRVIHLSAIGADPDAGTAYARTKHEGERSLMRRDLEWTILRPSLVIARNVYGGSALLRGLAGAPLATPMLATRGRFRPIHVDDLCDGVLRLLAPNAPTRTVIEAAGPQSATLAEFVAAQRAWLGFGKTRVWHAPAALAHAAFAIGDFFGRFGVRSALRSTSRAQMEHNVEGDPDDLPRQLGVHPRAYGEALSQEPAGVQDRWHARLYFVKMAGDVALALFWILTGVVCLTAGRAEAIALAQASGLGALAPWAADIGGAFDITMGAVYVFSARKTPLLGFMALVTLGYVGALTIALPWLWADPLGRLLKLIPFFALLGFLAAVDDPR